jgi:hypothetical protein
MDTEDRGHQEAFAVISIHVRPRSILTQTSLNDTEEFLPPASTIIDVVMDVADTFVKRVAQAGEAAPEENAKSKRGAHGVVNTTVCQVRPASSD